MGCSNISVDASGWEAVHSTRPLVRFVRMEYHSFHWYSIGEMHMIMGCSNISVDASGRKGVNSTRPLVRLACVWVRPGGGGGT